MNRTPWLILTAPISLPLIGFLVLSALGMGESNPPTHRKTMQRTITAAQLDAEHAEWTERRNNEWEEVPVIAMVWHPPTLSYELRPTTKWVRTNDQPA